MTDKGRHASDGGGAFYRDLAMMILGIVLVGGAVFFLLFLIADGPDSATTTVGEPASTTTTGQSTTTSEASTSSSTSTTPTTTTPTSTTVPVKPPEEVRVVVLNSTQLTGAAGRMTQQLDDAGYQTMQASDYTPEQDPSRIWYREGHSAEANELLEFLPDARVEPLPDDSIQPGADVVMILGTGYDG
ncbi:MAG: LytR C-terminal domain-containing protein [Acidimicrobiia bacterium]